jgi:dipeptidyl aminopeptidase/acylaminoacyl peptidase
LADIGAPIEIHHGTADDQVPLAWSQALYRRLQGAGKTAALFEYNGAGHTFAGDTWLIFMQRVTTFFDQAVKTVQPPS